MKKPSLKTAIEKDLSEKENFIFNQDTNKPLKGKIWLRYR